MIVTTEAIILKSVKFRESSKLLSVYTQQFGRCSLIANGSRKAKNKFGTALEPLTCSILTFYKHPNKDLHTLSTAEIAVPLRGIFSSFDALTAGLSIAEAVYRSQHDEEQNEQLYTLIKQTLQTLNSVTTNEYSLRFWFYGRLAGLMGFALHGEHYGAVIGSWNNENDCYLSLSDASAHVVPYMAMPTGFRIEVPTLRILHELLLIPPEQLSDVATIVIPASQMKELENFFAQYFLFHLDRRITERTQLFLRETRDY